MLKVVVLYTFATIFIGFPLQNAGKGIDVQIESFPYTASLRTYKTHVCAATILDSKHLLTAAHCIIGSPQNPTAFSVQHGLVKTSIDDISTITASKVVLHDRYLNDKKYDIAMIIVESEIPIDENKTIGYYGGFVSQNSRIKEADGEREDVEEKANITLLGWGYNTAGDITNLQSLDFKLYSAAECKGVDEKLIDTQYHICVEVELEHDRKCSSYSGSPLVSNKNVQLGIASWIREKGFNCIIVFTNVNTLSEWIRGKLLTT